MNFKNVLLILLVSISVIGQMKAETCYCSIQCGPREFIEGQDKPKIVSKSGFGPICFCRDRDIKKFKKNKCNPSQEEINSLDACS